MGKIEVAKELCLAKIKDVNYNPDMETFGKKIADLYNAIYKNLEISDNEE